MKKSTCSKCPKNTECNATAGKKEKTGSTVGKRQNFDGWSVFEIRTYERGTVTEAEWEDD